MRYNELLEGFLYPAGKKFALPSNIDDLRAPGVVKTAWGEPLQTHIHLDDGGRALFYNYASENVVEWPEVRARTKGYSDVDIIAMQSGDILVDRSVGDHSWGGDRNRYTTELATIARALLLAKVCTPRTKLYVGNWANPSDAELMGSVAEVAKRPALPNSLTLYHGTSTARWSIIESEGLKPLPLEQRIWNGRKESAKRPEHRAYSVYLTASKYQARYYATKATNADKARNTYSYVIKRNRARQDAEYSLKYWTGVAENKPMNDYTEEQIAKYQKEVDYWKSFPPRFYDKIEPVIFSVTITRAEYKNLLADDDWLARNPNALPTQWRESLSQFGQVAFNGVLPPERLKIVEKGPEALRW